MVCSHLSEIEQALLAAGLKETYRGQAWSKNCREWVYFDVKLDLGRIRQRFELASSVIDHENLDPRSGVEAGLACESCQDAIMGSPVAQRHFP